MKTGKAQGPCRKNRPVIRYSLLFFFLLFRCLSVPAQEAFGDSSRYYYRHVLPNGTPLVVICDTHSKLVHCFHVTQARAGMKQSEAKAASLFFSQAFFAGNQTESDPEFLDWKKDEAGIRMYCKSENRGLISGISFPVEQQSAAWKWFIPFIQSPVFAIGESERRTLQQHLDAVRESEGAPVRSLYREMQHRLFGVEEEEKTDTGGIHQWMHSPAAAQAAWQQFKGNSFWVVAGPGDPWETAAWMDSIAGAVEAMPAEEESNLILHKQEREVFLEEEERQAQPVILLSWVCTESVFPDYDWMRQTESAFNHPLSPLKMRLENEKLFSEFRCAFSHKQGHIRMDFFAIPSPGNLAYAAKYLKNEFSAFDLPASADEGELRFALGVCESENVWRRNSLWDQSHYVAKSLLDNEPEYRLSADASTWQEAWRAFRAQSEKTMGILCNAACMQDAQLYEWLDSLYPPPRPDTIPAKPADTVIPPPSLNEILFYAEGAYQPYTRDSSILRKVAGLMQAHPQMALFIDGHTDAGGSRKFNLDLSSKRAGVIRNRLVSDYGIDPGRIFIRAFGETRPLGNEPKKNRRVELSWKEASR